MSGTSAPRPGEERPGRIGFEWVECPRIEICGEHAHGSARPRVHRVLRWIALASKTPEHVRPGIANEDHEARVIRHAVFGLGRKPAKRREGRAAYGGEDRVFQIA